MPEPKRKTGKAKFARSESGRRPAHCGIGSSECSGAGGARRGKQAAKRKAPPDKPGRCRSADARKPARETGRTDARFYRKRCVARLRSGLSKRSLRKRRGVFSRAGNRAEKALFRPQGIVYTAGGFRRMRGENGESVKETKAERSAIWPTMSRKKVKKSK